MPNPQYSPTVLLIALLKTLAGPVSIKSIDIENVIGLGYTVIPTDGKLTLHFMPVGSESITLKPLPAAPPELEQPQWPTPNQNSIPQQPPSRTKVLDDRALVSREADQRRQKLAREVNSASDPYTEQQTGLQNKSFAP